MGIFSCLVGLSDLLFPGFSTVLGHVTRLPTIVAVSPKPAGVAFNCQGNALALFLLICRMRLTPSLVKNHVWCGQQFLRKTALAVYVAVVHVNLHIRVSYFV